MFPKQAGGSLAHWPGKFVIGLTGNIGTGKSVVRRMLEHMGAYGIDADALAHRAMARGAPGHARVVQAFGHFVVDSQGEIDRARLGRIVFNDPEALKVLEGILHPLVDRAVDLLVRNSTQPVAVIEAIKLLESGLGKKCDSIWVTYAPFELQMERLMRNRGMSEENARQRITSQPPAEQKLEAADVVIHNRSTFADTWRQVNDGWKSVRPTGRLVSQHGPRPAEAAPAGKAAGGISVQRAGPRRAADIAALLNRLQHPTTSFTEEDVMAAFGEKAFLILQSGDEPVGLVGWQVENLISRASDLLLDPQIDAMAAIPVLVDAVEEAARNLQCEASMILVDEALASHGIVWKRLGYEACQAGTLVDPAWAEAMEELARPGKIILFKQCAVNASCGRFDLIGNVHGNFYLNWDGGPAVEFPAANHGKSA